MCMTPGESLALWVLLLKKNQHDILNKKGDKKDTAKR